MNETMINELAKAPFQEAADPARGVAPEAVEGTALRHVLDQIDADAQHQPKKYLASSIVPAGGE